MEGGRDDAERVDELMGEGPKASCLAVDTDGVKIGRMLDKGDEGARFVQESQGPGLLEIFERVGEACAEAETLRREQIV